MVGTVSHPFSVNHRVPFCPVSVMLTHIHTHDCHLCINTNPASLLSWRMKQRLLPMAAAKYVNVSNAVFMFSAWRVLYSTSVFEWTEGFFSPPVFTYSIYQDPVFPYLFKREKQFRFPDTENHKSNHQCSSLCIIFQRHCTAEIKEKPENSRYTTQYTPATVTYCIFSIIRHHALWNCFSIHLVLN